MRYIQHSNRILIIGAMALWLWGATPILQAQSLKLPEGTGMATTQKVCGSCHGAELVIGRQESRDAWGAIVEDMIQRGAKGTDDEFYEVVDYLATHFSKSSPVVKINVNKDSQGSGKLLENPRQAGCGDRAEAGREGRFQIP